MSVLKERISTVPIDLDFSGPFWGTPLGEAVKGFAQAQNEIGWTSSLRASPAAVMLGLRGGKRDSPLVSDFLIQDGLLIKVKGGSKGRPELNPEQLLLAGLMLLYIERGYSTFEILENLGAMLGGTTLLQYISKVEGLKNPEKWHRTNNIFADSSPWKTFPLEPKNSGKTQSDIWSKV